MTSFAYISSRIEIFDIVMHYDFVCIYTIMIL